MHTRPNVPTTLPCPANGLERAAWFRRDAEHHQPGGYWHSRLIGTAAAIELRIEREKGMGMLDLRSAPELIGDANAMRLAAADVTGAHRAELLAGAATLEARAVGRDGHVTTPEQ